MKTALVFGCTGQVGSYVLEDLLVKDYRVFGTKRRSSSLNTERIDHIIDNPNLQLMYGDVTDYASVSNIVSQTKPDIFINCSAQSHVMVSFETACYTAQATGISVLNCLEAIRLCSPNTRFITMSSSEMFGGVPGTEPQNELTKLCPKSPYACAKAFGHYINQNYRESYGLFASSIIAFNNTSPRRGETFITRKTTRAATRIKLGLQDKLYVGNLDACRDFSHSKDIVDAIYRIIMADKPNDYVAASGKTYSIQYVVEQVFSKLGMNWKDHVVIDSKYFRPAEVQVLLGDSFKLRNELGWKPQYDFDMILDEMIESDMRLAQKEKLIMDNIQ
jgi:GDPmannose 4,6-dehydratase